MTRVVVKVGGAVAGDSAGAVLELDRRSKGALAYLALAGELIIREEQEAR